MAPEGKTSLFVEFFCWEGDEVGTMDSDELVALALRDLERLALIRGDQIDDAHHFRRSHVYPVYDHDYAARLSTVKTALDRFDNLLYIGRPGRFMYTNQDHSLEMGILAARAVIEGRRIDVEAIGTERAYFERELAR